MFVVALVVVLAAAALPPTTAAVHRSRALAAARYLSAQMVLARMQAVRRSAHVALRFEETASGIVFRTYVDGDRDGVRTSDIAAGVDPPDGPPVSLGDLFGGAAIAWDEGGAPLDAVRFGAGKLASFTPVGTSSSGTVYVRGRDGSQFAVRVLGATGRTRILRREPRTGRWADVPW